MSTQKKKKKKKKAAKILLERLDRVVEWLESRNYLERTPAFIPDYEGIYPELKSLTDHHDVIQKECLQLLEDKEALMDVKSIGGDHTKKGIHVIRWKSFMMKSGFMVKNSRLLCPHTFDLIQKIPGVSSAFFSILDPKQYIKAHRGYYQGIMRYHLGVVIPYNNEDNQCWLRINNDIEDNKVYDKKSIHKGAKYYWKKRRGYCV